MRESPFFQEYIKEAREEAQEIGQRKNRIKLILKFLNDQFQPEAVRELVPILERIEDIGQLEELAFAAPKSPTLEAFMEILEEQIPKDENQNPPQT